MPPEVVTQNTHSHACWTEPLRIARIPRATIHPKLIPDLRFGVVDGLLHADCTQERSPVHPPTLRVFHPLHTSTVLLRRRASHNLGMFLTYLALLSPSLAVLAAPLELTTNTEVNVEIDAGECASDASSSSWIHEVLLTSSDGPKFVPAFVQAGVGEVLRFTRWSENITVERSTFSSPCSSSRTIDGLAWVSESGHNLNQTLLVVQSLEPQWYSYHSDGKPEECSSDAVFAVNPGSSWHAFAARADMQGRGNLSQPLQASNSSQETATAQHLPTTATAETSSSSPALSRNTPDGNAWYPWTTMVATVTSFPTF